MPRRFALLAALATAVVTSSAFALGMRVGQARDSRIYELRTYTTNAGKLPALETRFREHTLQLFEKHGMRNEMYWVPTDSALRDNTLIYVISHDSREAAERSWKAFGADTTWQRVRVASEASGTILAKPPERVFMRLADFSPIANR